MRIVRVRRKIFALEAKAKLKPEFRMEIEARLSDEDKWKMGGLEEVYFEAEFDEKTKTWKLGKVVAKPDGWDVWPDEGF